MSAAMSGLLEECGVPPEKRQKLSDGMEGFMTKLVDNAIQQAVDASDTRWDARCEELMIRFMAQVDAKIAESEKRTDVKFEELMRRLTLVEVKGYITDWSKRNELALTRTEMKMWVESMVAQVGEEVKTLIDVQATLNSGSRVLFTRVDVCLVQAAVRDDAWKVKKEIDMLISKGGCKIRSLDPYVIVEPSPERRPYLQAGGRFLGYLEKHGVSKVNVKAEWGPPLRVYDIRGARPAQLAQFDTLTGWSLQQAALESLIPDVQVEQVMADLRK
ncbi:unnamed protein product [Prorocentrum cordatum]|uniref:DNA-directed DNA polymerase n=1 Tax=Prorocentrum cordatum TaxID=2364126 RepID=A0ABN9VJV5_9DINO|nr:unnamed protein product [Polarella glacialis]